MLIIEIILFVIIFVWLLILGRAVVQIEKILKKIGLDIEHVNANDFDVNDLKEKINEIEN